MVVIQPVTPLNARLFKSVRLRALLEDPCAFCSTYAKESQFSDSEWLARMDSMNGETGIGFLAMDGDAACGMVAAFPADVPTRRTHVVSMWTAPEVRRQGVGSLLIAAVAQWACQHESYGLQLMVASGNEAAIRFYERLGFARTGHTEPYPNDPSTLQVEMVLPISDGRPWS